MKMLTHKNEVKRKGFFLNQYKIWVNPFSSSAPQEKMKAVTVPTGIFNKCFREAPSLRCFLRVLLCNFLIQVLYEKSPKTLNGHIDNTFLHNLKTVFSFSPNFFSLKSFHFLPTFYVVVFSSSGQWNWIVVSEVSYLYCSYAADLLFLLFTALARSKEAKWEGLEKEEKHAGLEHWHLCLHELTMSGFLCFT